MNSSNIGYSFTQGSGAQKLVMGQLGPKDLPSHKCKSPVTYSEFFFCRPVHILNQKRCHHGWWQVEKFSKFVPPDTLKMHSLALPVLRFWWEWPSGLRHCYQNWKVAGSNPTRHLPGLRDPTSLQGSQWPSDQICKMQLLTLGEWGCPLDNDPNYLSFHFEKLFFVDDF